ncbi:hypothetical protein [Novosphingobium album (ex Hu et al. 2023)]|uniref:Uncharacterized protein n=1 Tax=Novosphingobium album (ex Hu et al. 2023) TaxID=2930093 RepID=A0ABT0AZQ9_9SPHN|nr:hypothetical protein [Novosphingobium album (ex Hu et al. 2023)]MCJ2178272.1 hypothetical protein [Novosphingobium album (ex Hu et al. 2023)]
MRDLMHDCLASAPHEECDRVREAALLLQSGGRRDDHNPAVESGAVDQMLSCGAVESAVLAMLRPGTVFMLSRGQENCCLATVITMDGADEVIAEGATLSLALLSAYVAGLVADVEDVAATRHHSGASGEAWMH